MQLEAKSVPFPDEMATCPPTVTTATLERRPTLSSENSSVLDCLTVTLCCSTQISCPEFHQHVEGIQASRVKLTFQLSVFKPCLDSTAMMDSRL